MNDRPTREEVQEVLAWAAAFPGNNIHHEHARVLEREVRALQAENKQALEALAVAAEYAHEQHEKNEKLIETGVYVPCQHQSGVTHRASRCVYCENDKLKAEADKWRKREEAEMRMVIIANNVVEEVRSITSGHDSWDGVNEAIAKYDKVNKTTSTLAQDRIVFKNELFEADKYAKEQYRYYDDEIRGLKEKLNRCVLALTTLSEWAKANKCDSILVSQIEIEVKKMQS